MNHPCGGGLKVKHKIHKYLSKKQQHKSPVITTTTTTKRAHFNYNKTTKIHGFDQSRSFYCSMSKSQADGNSQHIGAELYLAFITRFSTPVEQTS